MPKITDELYIFNSFYDDIRNKMVHKKYYYMNALNHLNMIFESNDFKRYNKVYWEEILLRSHYSSTVSILRHEKWLKGVILSIEKNNYILFCSSLRGFLESVTDSYYSLLNVPFDLSNNFYNINLAIKGELEQLFISQELEETLIHFQFAKKVRKSDKNPDYLKALTTTEYINIFSPNEDKKIKDLYKLLCEVVHPASESVNLFNRTIKVDDDLEYTTTDLMSDEGKINEVISNFSNEISQLLKLSINTPFICLKILGLFSFEPVKSKYIDRCTFNTYIDSNIWAEFLRLIEHSDRRNNRKF